MINPNKVGFVFAAILGGWHAAWALLVLAGWAQPFLDFIFWAHMIRPIYVVKAFDPAAALTLVLVTAAMGFVMGWAAGAVWNKLHGPARAEAMQSRKA